MGVEIAWPTGKSGCQCVHDRYKSRRLPAECLLTRLTNVTFPRAGLRGLSRRSCIVLLQYESALRTDKISSRAAHVGILGFIWLVRDGFKTYFLRTRLEEF